MLSGAQEIINGGLGGLAKASRPSINLGSIGPRGSNVPKAAFNFSSSASFVEEGRKVKQHVTADEKKRNEMLKALGVDFLQAVTVVKRGQVIMKQPDDDLPGTLRAKGQSILEMIGLRPAQEFFFIVIDDGERWHTELRWAQSQEQATTMNALERLRLSDVRYVTATVIDQTSDLDEKMVMAREFRIICTNRTLKLTAPSRDCMKNWVTALSHLARETQGNSSTKHTKMEASVKHFIQRISLQAQLDEVDEVERDQLASVLRKGNIGGSAAYVGQLFTEFDADYSEGLNLDEFADLFHFLSLKDALTSYFSKYALTLVCTTSSGRPVLLNPVRPSPSRQTSPSQFESSSTTRTSGVAKLGSVVSNGMEEDEAYRVMSSNQFLHFLVTEQREKHFFGANSGLQSAGGLLGQLREPLVQEIEGDWYLTEMGFSSLMCSAENALFDPARRARVGQDMKRPLSYYWIASSHNTFLGDDQLVGKSSLEQYIDVLMRGCRCVEIDCWDGDDGEPKVTHGWTPTSALRFQDVIRVCRDYGFLASPYPLILSLEVHCGLAQRARMAAILKELLGAQLLLHPLGVFHDTADLVSPEEAKLKVIVKAKAFRHARKASKSEAKYRTNDSTASTNSRSNGSVDDAPTRSPSTETAKSGWSSKTIRTFSFTNRSATKDCEPGADESPLKTLARSKSRSLNVISNNLRDIRRHKLPSIDLDADDDDRNWTSVRGLSTDDEESDFLRCDSPAAGLQSQDALPTPKVTEEYSRTIYLLGCKLPKGKIVDILKDVVPCGCTSLNELKAKALLESNGVNAVRMLCMHQLMRAYPGSSRIGSSNFDPLPLLLGGFQIVALNYQSLDLPAIINEGLFLHENGGCGYILKPPTVRLLETFKGASVYGADERSRPRSLQEEEDLEADSLSCTLALRVFSGHCFPKAKTASEADVISPFVRISLRGTAEDSRTVETKTVIENGFNPMWDEEFIFHIAKPSVAVLAFEVITAKGSRREFVSAVACPMIGIRQGIRWVQLRDWRHHEIDYCGLLVSVRASGPWADMRRWHRQQHTAPNCTEVDTTFASTALADTIPPSPEALNAMPLAFKLARKYARRVALGGASDEDANCGFLTDHSSGDITPRSAARRVPL